MEFDFDSNMQAYSGYYLDNNNLKKVASGGAASVLAEVVIGMKGIVYGVCYSGDFRKVKFYRATSLADLELIKGSKYVYADKKVCYNGIDISVYEAAAQDLKKNEIVLFTGLGCDIGGMLAYCNSKGINTKNLYTLDLICQGPTFPEAQSSYIELLENKFKSEITFFSVRYKKNGWVPPYVHAEFKNGKVFEQKWTESELFYAFSRFARKTCVNCKFKGNNHKADITVGDFWGIQPGMEGYNENGVSVFLIRSEKGKQLLEHIDRTKFVLNHANATFIIENNPMFFKTRTVSNNVEKFEKNLKKKGLHYAIQKDRGFIKALYCEVYTYLKGVYS